jgi:hypothetical protein
MAMDDDVAGPPEPSSAAPAASPASPDETDGEAPAGALGRIRQRAGAMAEPLVGGASTAIEAAAQRVGELPAMRVRRIRRRGREPLPSLADLYPESRLARPVEVGLSSITADEIAGTAVGGGDQRGGDFLPLKPFRSMNWHARWQRLRKAQDSLAVLPPIDVVKYAGRYWVVDGHNRVALALYGGQQEIDASVVELIPPGGRRTEPIVSMEAQVEAARPMRTRAAVEGTDDPPS